MKNTLVLVFLILFGCTTAAQDKPLDAQANKPNILFILADDLGYGDVACYNPQSNIPTPNLDQLAQRGMRFTDAHSPSTACTPSRYSLMTGDMPYRGSVFTGVGGPSLIAEDRLTLPRMLREAGYATACVGKWHIGLTFHDNEGRPINQGGLEAVKRVDYSRKITGGPTERGFDYFFGTACCPTTDWLYAYIENDRIPTPPTGLLDKTNLPKHPYSRDNRQGMIAPDFDLEEVDLVFLEKSRKFIREHVKKNPGKPFFLFHSMQAVHLPSFPADRFKGKTQAGPHGDFIYEMDWIVGELMKTLKEAGAAENTLVMFGSDNGPELPTVIAMRRDHNHDGARPWRGMKRDDWEGGHRTPFIACWPGKIPAGVTSDQTINLVDVMATCAAIVGYDLPNDAAEDSYNMLPVLLGQHTGPQLRPYTMQHTIRNVHSIRRAQWKYLDHKGSGGNNYERTGEWGAKPFALPEKAPNAPGQLYNLQTDPGETDNLYFKYPQVTKELKTKLDTFRETGRSTPERK